MIAGLYFTFGFTALLLVVNGLRKPTAPTHRLPPLWLFGMLASESAGFWAAVVPAVTGLAALGGALRSPVGNLGFWLSALAWLGQLEIWRRSRASSRTIGPPVELPRSLVGRAFSWPYEVDPGVDREEIQFAIDPNTGRPLSLDLYRPIEVESPLPLVIHVHGGGWQGGNPRQSGQVIIQHLARSGWAVAAIEYPLSPAATFPDHLFGVDAAIEWAAARSDITGPIVLMGASAGAHLASVAALTRPGIDGFIGSYGIYDFFNRHQTRHDWPLIPRVVMKTTSAESPELYRQASPLDLVHDDSPPFLLIHGTFDSLVPPAEAHHLARELTAVGASVEVLEVPYAQHGYDSLAGRRARSVAARVVAWLDANVLSQHESTAPSDI